MTGRQRIVKVMEGDPPDRMPILPMIHTGLAGLCGVPLGHFFSDARAMSEVMVEGYRRFGFDGSESTAAKAVQAASNRMPMIV